MTAPLFERHRVIDIDTHVTEPPDVFTSRVSSRWKMHWQWKNSGVIHEHPEWDLLPSEYFQWQIYGSFWFEEKGASHAIELYPDNILYETDYPHPTCMAPGPASAGTHPALYAEKVLEGLSETVISKVLHDTAADIYGLA